MIRNTRESGHCIHHQQGQFTVCKLFSPKASSNFVKREGFNDWRNTIVTKEAPRHLLTCLTLGQDLGLGQQLEKLIKEQCH